MHLASVRTVLAILAVAAGARSAWSSPSPEAGVIEAVLFLDGKADARAVEKQLTAMLTRAAARTHGSVEGPSQPIIDVVRRPSVAPLPEGDVVEFRVTLPDGSSRESFLQALAQDEECRASRESCRTHCMLLDQIATGGHWHLKNPVGNRQCLAVFAANGEDAGEMRQLVLGQPGEFGLRRKPRVGRVKITLGRPDFRNLPK